MKLAYIAFNQNGRQVTNVIEAASVGAATEALRRQGLYITQISLQASDGRPAATRRSGGGSRSRRMKNVAMFMRQMHALISCGTPLVQSLGALERQTRQGPWRDAITDVRTRVEEGSTLSAAMEEHPNYFDNVSRSLVAAGEASGDLASMVDRIATITRKQLHVRNTIRGAMIYPSLLLVVAVTVMAVLLLAVVPRFGELFQGLDVPLPPTTQILLSVSHFVRGYWWLVLILAAIPIVALRFILTSEGGKRNIDILLLKLPQVGNVSRSFATARIARLLGVLMQSHVAVLDALRLTRQSVDNSRYVALMVEAEEAVTHGKPISSAFENTDLISPAVCEAIRSGEQSGQVGPLLINIADFLDEENEVVLRSLTSIIEPVILIGMGLLVATVAISLFTPMFDLTAMAQGGK